MKRIYEPEVPMMNIYVTPNELIAIGGVLTQYLVQCERTPDKTKEQLELMALLRSFQGRIVCNVPGASPLRRQEQR